VKWLYQALIFLAVFLLMGLFVKQGGCTPPRATGTPPGARIVDLSVAGRPTPQETDLAAASFTIHAEVADTQQARQQGLVGRAGLQPGYGMLYVYPEPRQAKFDWSQMSFAVSDAFLAPDGTILDIQQAGEHDPTPYTAPNPVKFVLEVRQGWFADRGVKAGDRIVLPADLTGAQKPPAASPAPPEGAKTGPAPAPAAPQTSGDRDEGHP
jgi:uncharacterized membrane protein (UPF0127 family)